MENKIIITVYRYKRRLLPQELYERMRGDKEWFPANGEYDWHEPNARYYWEQTTLDKAKNFSFGLEYVCAYTSFDREEADKFFKKLFCKSAIPEAFAVQIVRRCNGRFQRERYQWGVLAYPSRAKRWCKVSAFSGTATQAKEAEIVR